MQKVVIISLFFNIRNDLLQFIYLFIEWLPWLISLQSYAKIYLTYSKEEYVLISSTLPNVKSDLSPFRLFARSFVRSFICLFIRSMKVMESDDK